MDVVDDRGGIDPVQFGNAVGDGHALGRRQPEQLPVEGVEPFAGDEPEAPSLRLVQRGTGKINFA